jgi:NAD(P) transhydrogenase subunit alpha
MIMTDTWMFFTSTLAQAVTAAAANSEVADSSHLMLLITVFALAVFVGVEIIAKIPPTLHTPLMSGSNAISGITVIGAILATGSNVSTVSSVFGFLAVVLATINVVGGFMVTNRMLAMFKPKK